MLNIEKESSTSDKCHNIAATNSQYICRIAHMAHGIAHSRGHSCPIRNSHTENERFRLCMQHSARDARKVIPFPFRYSINAPTI